MKQNEKIILLFLMVLVLLFMAPNILNAVDYVFFLSGNYAGGLDVKNTNWSQKKDYGFLIIYDNGSITSGSVSSLAGSQIGAQVFFTPNIGISLSANFYFKKAEFDLDSIYKYHYVTQWGWDNSEDAGWTGAGNMKVTPINLNLVYSYLLFKNMNINIPAGRAFLRNSLRLGTKFDVLIIIPTSFILSIDTCL